MNSDTVHHPTVGVRRLLTPSLLYYATLVVCFCVEWIMFVHKTGIQTSNLLFDFIHCLGDMLIVMLPFWFVGRRLRIVPLILLWLFALLLIGNVLYFRFWNDVLSPISISMVGNLNEELTDAVGMLWYAEDLKYLLFPVIATVVYFLCRPLDARYSRRVRIWMTVAALGLFGLGRLFDSNSAPTQNNAELADGRLNRLSKEVVQLKRGMLLYSAHSVQNFRYWIWFRNQLSDRQRNKIEDFIEDIPCRATHDFSANADKNLVVVIVESLNGSIVGKEVNGVEITPVLNSLIAAPGSIWSADVVSQIRDGVSSDGQMMVQTGLLPLWKGSASILVGDENLFPALPSRFPGYECMAVFASGAHVWREGRTHTRYGYKVYSKNDFRTRSELLGADGAMFEAGAQLIEADTTARFLLTMLTASMHVPFVDEAALPVEAWSSLPEDLRNYYTVSHYFDAQLGVFVNFLREAGLYDDTVLVVTSDHSQMATSDGAYEPAFFGAFNTGVTMAITSPIGQVNIYPAILEIMDRLPAEGYRGMGPSALDPALRGAIDGHGHPHGATEPWMYDAFEISDRIIRGDYFAP